jgi:hypothetical protein
MPESKAQTMAAELKDQYLGFVVRQGSIALIGPGAPFTIIPRPTYDEIDLNEAVEQGLLQKTTWTLYDHTGKSSPF